jgi:hypothetical protein
MTELEQRQVAGNSVLLYTELLLAHLLAFRRTSFYSSFYCSDYAGEQCCQQFKHGFKKKKSVIIGKNFS